MNMTIYDSYIKKLSLWGRLTMLFGLVASFVPPVFLWIVYGVVPTAENFAQMLPLLISATIVGSFIEPLTAFPIIGVTGSYAGWLTGSVLNMKAPCALAAQSAAEVEPGTPESTIVTNLSIPISTAVALVFTFLGALLGGLILKILPDSVLATFSFLGPAIFGSLLGNYISKYPIVGLAVLVLCIILKALGLPFWALMPLACIIGIVANLNIYKKKYAEEQK